MAHAAMSSKFLLQEVKEAMIEYYTLLCRMPHLESNCLRVAPSEGWPDFHAESMKDRGWSDEAAQFVRHLPYLAPGKDAEHAWITSSSTAVAFDQPLPGSAPRISPEGHPSPPYLPSHVVYIGRGHYEGHSYLLLDTQLGHIVRYWNYGERHLLPSEEYHALPIEEKWMAHPTLPAKVFFEHECTRLRRLVYVPVPRRNGPKFYQRAETARDEAELLAVEDEFEADHEADSDYCTSENGDTHDDLDLKDLEIGSDEDDPGEDSDSVISEAEIEWLRHDAEHGEYQPSVSLHSWKAKDLPEVTVKVYEIYKRNGWPYDHFDVEECRKELAVLESDVDRQQKIISDEARQKRKEEYLRRLTPEQLSEIEAKKKLAEQM